MKLNYGYEYAKFRAEQKKQREYYLSLGMAEEAIAEIEKFDKEEFLRELAHKRNTIAWDLTTPFEKDDESKNPLYERNFYQLTVTIDTYKPQTRYGWIDEIENPLIYKAIQQLSDEQLELITLMAFDDLNQVEIALILGITKQAVNNRLARIQKKFKEILG